MFLNIIHGKHAGNKIELELDTFYTISNQFGDDVFIDPGFVEHVSVSFTLEKGTILFHEADNSFRDVNDNILNSDKAYPLPLEVHCGEVAFVVSEIDDLVSKNKLKSINSSEGIDIDYLSSETLNDDYLEREAETEINFDLNEKFQDFLSNNNEGYNAKGGIRSKINLFKSKLLVKLSPLIQRVTRNKVCLKYLNIVGELYRRNKLIFLVCFGGSILFCLIILIAIINSDSIGGAQQNDHTVALQEKKLLQKKLIGLPKKYAHIRLTRENGRFLLNGVVESTVQVNYLKQEFVNFKNLDNKVRYFDEVSPVIQKILTEHKLNLRYGFDADNGDVYFKGIVPANKSIDDVVIDINSQLPMLFDINNSSMFLETEVESDINNILDDKKYRQSLSGGLDPIKNVVNINGYLPYNQINKFNQQVNFLQTKYKSVFKVQADVQDISKALPFKIVEVYTGNQSYIVTDKGETIFPGGGVKGMNLVSINSNQLVFQGKYKFIINLSELFSSNDTQSINAFRNENGRKFIVTSELDKISESINKFEADISSLRELRNSVIDSKKVSILDNHMKLIEAELEELKRSRHYLESEINNENMR